MEVVEVGVDPEDSKRQMTDDSGKAEDSNRQATDYSEDEKAEV